MRASLRMLERISYRRVKDRVFDALDGKPGGGPVDTAVYFGLLALILVSTGAVVIESLPSVKADPVWHARLNLVERASLWIFAAEYVLRLWSCPTSLVSRWKLARHPLMVIDLLALLPLWGPWIGIDIRKYPLLRAVRVLRMLKLTQYLPGFDVVARVVRSKARELGASLGMIALLTLCGATALYFCERAAQADKFVSIPHTMWWAVISVTTTGYGDMYPVTPAGQVVAGLFVVLGVLFFSLPTAILGGGFIEEWQRRKP